MAPTVQPVTFYVPSSSAEPVEVKVSHSGLRMALANRESVPLLDDSWAVLGVYFLLGSAEDQDPDRYRAYVGEVGKRDLLTRVKEHVGVKQWWSRALLIASASDDFNSAEIGWLEGRLYDVLLNSVAAQVMNKGRPGDNSLAPQDREVLERYVQPVMAALRACGTSPDTADQKPPAPLARKRKIYKESVKDLLDAGLLKPGTQLKPLRKDLSQTALVLPDGNLGIDGSVYTAVSPAAQAVSGNKSEPGWDFWGAPSGGGGYVPLFQLRERLREDTGATLAPAAATPTAAVPQASAPALQAVGLEAAGSRTTTHVATRRTPRRFTERLSDLITAKLLSPGDELRPVRKTHSSSRARLLGDGRVELDGTLHASLSAAAVAVSGNKAEPGWEFWAVDHDGELVTLYELRDRLRAMNAATSGSTSPSAGE